MFFKCSREAAFIEEQRRKKEVFYKITIMIFFLGIFLVCIRGREYSNCKSKIVKTILEWISRENLNEYLVNTMIAFLGVTAAILFTNFNTTQVEKKQTIKYLDDVLVNGVEIEGAFVTRAMFGLDPSAYIQVIIEGEGITEENTSVEIEQEFKPEDLFETMKVYPLSSALSLDILLNDAPYRHTISKYSYSALNSIRKSLALQKTRLENAESIEEMQKHLEHMIIDFQNTFMIVEIELDYQKGNISEEEVYNQIDKLFDELIENEDVLVIG